MPTFWCRASILRLCSFFKGDNIMFIDQVDTAIVPDVRCQRGSASTSCAVLVRASPACAGNCRDCIIKAWSLTSSKEKLIKIGAKVVSHGRYVAFPMAEVATPRQVFQEILRLIAELRPQPRTSTSVRRSMVMHSRATDRTSAS